MLAPIPPPELGSFWPDVLESSLLPEPGMEEDAEMKLLLLESAQDGGERRDEAAEIQKVWKNN